MREAAGRLPSTRGLEAARDPPAARPSPAARPGRRGSWSGGRARPRASRRRRAPSGPARAVRGRLFRWPARPGRRAGAARWTTLLTATATVTNSSSASRFLRLGDGERVQRRGEVPVEQQAGGHGGEHGGPEAAEDRDRDHRDQVDEQVVGQVQVRPARPTSTAVSSGSPAAASDHARDEPTAADRADRAGQVRRPVAGLGVRRRLATPGPLRGLRGRRGRLACPYTYPCLPV